MCFRKNLKTLNRKKKLKSIIILTNNKKLKTTKICKNQEERASKFSKLVLNEVSLLIKLAFQGLV
jgi:hypothetical protein